MTRTELPRTWRPLGTSLAGVGFGLMLVVLSLVLWIAWGADVRSRFTFFQKATVVALGVAFLAILHALVRCRVTARSDGLVVVNGYRSRHFDWAQPVAVNLRRGAPFATLDLSDGSTLSLWGIQGSDGGRAVRAVQQLRGVLAEQSRTERDD
ncbi:MAG TPA: PH domain-containing protein [Marmoricola sp.]|jgi:hypothetical protein|nr:PH domain-containing protein [Marmoricola sp.]